MNDCKQVGWKVTYANTSSKPTTGTLLIEHMVSIDYAETWYLLDTIDCAALGGDVGSGTYPGQIEFMRYRFSVSADNGGVNVDFDGLLDVD
jgi:hypothetical protein